MSEQNKLVKYAQHYAYRVSEGFADENLSAFSPNMIPDELAERFNNTVETLAKNAGIQHHEAEEALLSYLVETGIQNLSPDAVKA